MRLVIALGGNALLRRGEALTAANQRQNMREAAAALARACEGHQVALVHGNGPQVGLLALEAEAYTAVPPYPLDVLGAESQGMIGYVIAQELRNAMPLRRIAGVLTQTLADLADPAFTNPTKPIGPVYPTLADADAKSGPEVSFAADGGGFRRVVPSPRPCGIVELEEIRTLFEQDVVTICCGGGGIPVASDGDGRLRGLEAVIDKDLTAALLAERLAADALIILTDIDAVYAEWGTSAQRPIREITAEELAALAFADGSMLPKVQAVIQFVKTTGRPARIGNLSELDALMKGLTGTLISA